jgi:hypothetical protein
MTPLERQLEEEFIKNLCDLSISTAKTFETAPRWRITSAGNSTSRTTSARRTAILPAFLSALYAQIVAESEKLDSLKTHKRGLMQQLFPAAEGD